MQTPGKIEKQYLAGALNLRTGRLTWVEADRIQQAQVSSSGGQLERPLVGML